MKNQPKIVRVGRPALESGAPLFVRGLDGYWIPALPGTRTRARRMSEHSLWIYGVESLHG